MKRVFQKAIAFVTAVATAASVAVSASAASAAKRIVKDSGYKQVIATDSGLFFTNFSETEIRSGTSSKTVLCVTPEGTTKKVKVKDSKNVYGCNMVNTSSVFIDYGAYNNFMQLSNTDYELIFTNGKSIVSDYDSYDSIDYGKYALVTTGISKDSNGRKDYSKATYKLYDGKGNLVFSAPRSALKGASSDSSITIRGYAPDAKSALFYEYDYEAGAANYWLVRNKKTIAVFKDIKTATYIVQNSKGSSALRLWNADTMNYEYYSAKTGKKVSNFVEQYNDTEDENYSVKLSGNKYKVLNKSGKTLYTIASSKVAGYHIYDKSVAIVTKSGSKYGLIMVK